MNSDDGHPVIRACVAWIGVGISHLGIHTWSDAAAVVATVYTGLLIVDWCLRRWKGRAR